MAKITIIIECVHLGTGMSDLQGEQIAVSFHVGRQLSVLDRGFSSAMRVS